MKKSARSARGNDSATRLEAKRPDDWRKLSRTDVQNRVRHADQKDVFLFSSWHLDTVSRGERVMAKFLEGHLNEGSIKPEVIDFFCYAFALILYGEDPIAALRLHRPKTGRNKVPTERIERIGGMVDNLARNGTSLTKAYSTVAQEKGINLSRDAVRKYYKKYLDQMTLTANFENAWRDKYPTGDAFWKDHFSTSHSGKKS